MSQRSARLARKASRLLQSEQDQEFDAKVRTAITERDAALREANVQFYEAIKSLKVDLSTKRKTAWDRYDERRAALIKMTSA